MRARSAEMGALSVKRWQWRKNMRNHDNKVLKHRDRFGHHLDAVWCGLRAALKRTSLLKMHVCAQRVRVMAIGHKSTKSLSWSNIVVYDRISVPSSASRRSIYSEKKLSMKWRSGFPFAHRHCVQSTPETAFAGPECQ